MPEKKEPLAQYYGKYTDQIDPHEFAEKARQAYKLDPQHTAKDEEVIQNFFDSHGSDPVWSKVKFKDPEAAPAEDAKSSKAPPSDSTAGAIGGAAGSIANAASQAYDWVGEHVPDSVKKFADKPLWNGGERASKDLMEDARKRQAGPNKKTLLGGVENDDHKHLRAFEEGFAAGAVESLGGLTSPKNMALLLPGMILGKAKKGGKLLQWTLKAAKTGGHIWFTADMLKDLSAEAPEAARLYLTGDYAGAGRAAAKAASDILFISQSTGGAGKQVGEAVAGVSKRVNLHTDGKAEGEAAKTREAPPPAAPPTPAPAPAPTPAPAPVAPTPAPAPEAKKKGGKRTPAPVTPVAPAPVAPAPVAPAAAPAATETPAVDPAKKEEELKQKSIESHKTEAETALDETRKKLRESSENLRTLRGKLAPDAPATGNLKVIKDSKPRYGYKDKQLKTHFENDLDKAVYIAGNPLTRSKADPQVRKWLEAQGYGEEEITEHYNALKEHMKEAGRRTAVSGDDVLYVDKDWRSEGSKPQRVKPPVTPKAAAKTETPRADSATEPVKPGYVKTEKGDYEVTILNPDGTPRKLKVKNEEAAKRVLENQTKINERAPAEKKVAPPKTPAAKAEVVPLPTTGKKPAEAKAARAEVDAANAPTRKWYEDKQKDLREFEAEPIDEQFLTEVLGENEAKKAKRQGKKNPGIEFNYQGKDGLLFKAGGKIYFIAEGGDETTEVGKAPKTAEANDADRSAAVDKAVENVKAKAEAKKTVNTGTVNVPEKIHAGDAPRKPQRSAPPVKPEDVPRGTSAPTSDAQTSETPAAAATGGVRSVTDHAIAEDLGLDPDRKYIVSGAPKGGKFTLRDDAGSVTTVKATQAEMDKLFGEKPKREAPPVSERDKLNALDKSVAESFTSIEKSNSYPATIRTLDAGGGLIEEVKVDSAAQLKALKEDGSVRTKLGQKDPAFIELEVPGMKIKGRKPLKAAAENEAKGTDFNEARASLKKKIRNERGSFSLKPESIDSSTTKELGIVGRELLMRGKTNLKDWANSMTQELGRPFTPYAKSIWENLFGDRKARAEAENRGVVYKNGTIYMSKKVADAFFQNSSTKKTDGRFFGEPESGEHIEMIQKMMANLPQEDIAQMAAALKQSAADGHYGTVFVDASGPIGTVKALVRHEWQHRKQLQQDSKTSIPGSAITKLLDSQAAKKMLPYLIRSGYPANAFVMWLEMGANLAAGPEQWKRSVLTHAEAKDAFREYVRSMILNDTARASRSGELDKSNDEALAKHVVNYIDNFKRITPYLNEVLKQTRREFTGGEDER